MPYIFAERQEDETYKYVIPRDYVETLTFRRQVHVYISADLRPGFIKPLIRGDNDLTKLLTQLLNEGKTEIRVLPLNSYFSSDPTIADLRIHYKDDENKYRQRYLYKMIPTLFLKIDNAVGVPTEITFDELYSENETNMSKEDYNAYICDRHQPGDTFPGATDDVSYYRIR